METLIIDILENKSSLVKSLLKELGVTIHEIVIKKLEFRINLHAKPLKMHIMGLELENPYRI